jgi:hypothetical protein
MIHGYPWLIARVSISVGVLLEFHPPVVTALIEFERLSIVTSNLSRGMRGVIYKPE